MPKPTCKPTIELITPKRAKEMLARNTNNYRKKDPRLAKKYSLDMTNDRWKFQGDPIKFAENGTLYDGQHRLQAVVDSGRPQWFLVLWKMPDENISLASEDTGRKRSVASHLTFNGLTKVRTKAASARQLILMADSSREAPLITDSEIAEFVRDNNEVFEELMDACGTKAFEAFTPASLITGLFCVYTVDEDVALEAARIAGLKETVSSDNPVLVARNQALLARSRSEKRDPRYDIAMVARACKCLRDGESVRHFRRSVKFAYPGFSVDSLQGAVQCT